MHKLYTQSSQISYKQTHITLTPTPQTNTLQTHTPQHYKPTTSEPVKPRTKQSSRQTAITPIDHKPIEVIQYKDHKPQAHTPNSHIQ